MRRRSDSPEGTFVGNWDDIFFAAALAYPSRSGFIHKLTKNEQAMIEAAVRYVLRGLEMQGVIDLAVPE